MPTQTEASVKVQEVATMVAGKLLTLAQHQGGEAANDRQFQKLLNYGRIDQTEQDRCFNELVVTAIGYVYYRLDDELLPRQMWEFSELIRQAFPPTYRKQLVEMGVAEPFADQWLELLDMRLKEYGENLEQMGPALRLDMASDDRDESSPQTKQLTIRLALISTTGLEHLRRGKLDEQDPLRKYLRAWLFAFEKELYPIMEKMSAIAKHEYEPSQ